VPRRRPRGSTATTRARPLDRAALAEHEVLQQLELLERELRGLALDVHAAAEMSIVTHRERGRPRLVLLRAGDGARLVQREAHDVDVATAGGRGRQGDRGIGLGVGASSPSVRRRASTSVESETPSAAAFASSMPT
jgi:hypothetical protein